MNATGILVAVNTLFILMAFNLQQIGSFNLILLIVGLMTLLTGILFYFVRQKRIAQKATEMPIINNDGSVRLSNNHKAVNALKKKVSRNN